MIERDLSEQEIETRFQSVSMMISWCSAGLFRLPESETILYRKAADKQLWKSHAEAFVQPWDTNTPVVTITINHMNG